MLRGIPWVTGLKSREARAIFRSSRLHQVRRPAGRRLRGGRENQASAPLCARARGGIAQCKEALRRGGGGETRFSATTNLKSYSLACTAAARRSAVMPRAREQRALACLLCGPPLYFTIPGGPAGGPPGARGPCWEGRGTRERAGEGRWPAAPAARGRSALLSPAGRKDVEKGGAMRQGAPGTGRDGVLSTRAERRRRVRGGGRGRRRAEGATSFT